MVDGSLQPQKVVASDLLLPGLPGMSIPTQQSDEVSDLMSVSSVFIILSIVMFFFHRRLL